MSVTSASLAESSTVLVLPGLNGSGPRHWQSVWQRRHTLLAEIVRISARTRIAPGSLAHAAVPGQAASAVGGVP